MVMPYAPQGNSTAKRMHLSMAEYLRRYTNTSDDDWECFRVGWKQGDDAFTLFRVGKIWGKMYTKIAKV